MKLGRERDRKKAENFNLEYAKYEVKWYGNLKGDLRFNWQGLTLKWEKSEGERITFGNRGSY
jgi:hypothetical protein